MQIYHHLKYGPPESLVLKAFEKPTPAADEVLVKVKASTVNRTDCAILRAKPFIMRFVSGLSKPRNKILGTDFAGEIEAIGTEVSQFKVGDRVFGFDDVGLSSHAPFLTIKEKAAVVKMPKGASFETAAASAEGVHYAINTLNKIKLKKGQHVLVNGATGAIGSATLQLAKHAGAIATAVCAGEYFDRIKALGADHLIDYLKEDFTQSKQEFDFVFDCVGKSSFSKCKPIMKASSIYISSELGWMAQNIFFALSTPIKAKLRGINGTKTVIFPIPVNPQESLNFIKGLLEDGQFKPLIDRTYSLTEIPQAFEYVEQGQKIGNVLIQID